jgi:hypothetical protein
MSKEKGNKDAKDGDDSRALTTSAARKFKRSLPVEMNAEDTSLKAMKAGKLSERIEKLEAEIKAKSAEEKEALKKKKAELRSVLGDLAKGTEEREVPCEEVMDYRANKVRVMRLDTNEEVESREMLPTERQLKAKAVKDSEDATANA